MKCDSTKILAVFFALLPSLGMAAEQAMGRLFFTPEQRARMDVARQHERSIKIEADPQENEPPAANITLNGVITRSDGKTTVWINNKEQSVEKAGSVVAVPGRGKPAGQISVTTSNAKRPVPLKVGQSVDMSSGQVDEIFRRPPPVLVPGKDAPSASSPGVAKSHVPPSLQDEAPEAFADVHGDIPPSR